MRILLFQHATEEHPGSFRHLLKADGHTLDTVELDKGHSIPPFDNYDALWVMGGPMDVWQEESHPWLVGEKAAIKSAVVDNEMPFLGVCLGHQLLADALGGTVGPSKIPEIGVLDVDVTSEGQQSPFFNGVPHTIKSLQWHSAEVQTLPPNCSILASSPACAINAMGYGDRALTIQFHVEVEPDTVTNWAGIPEYAAALEKALGPNGSKHLDSKCQVHQSEFDKVAHLIYHNWCSQC